VRPDNGENLVVFRSLRSIMTASVGRLAESLMITCTFFPLMPPAAFISLSASFIAT